MKFIESHVHIWTLSDPSFPGHPDRTFTPEADRTADDLFAAQDQIGGVDWTVLIQPRFYLTDNSYLSQAALDRPDKFVVVGRVDPMHVDAAAHLRELMERPGLRGIRVAPFLAPEERWLDLPSQDPLWETAADTQATIGLLVDWFQIPQAEVMARRHPDVTIVIDHLGRPEWDDPSSLDNLVVLAEHGNVSVKLSGYPHGTGDPYPYAGAHPFIERTFRAYGAERLMWGSDWPMFVPDTEYRQAFQSAWDLEFLTDDDRAWIFEKTARRAWRIPG